MITINFQRVRVDDVSLGMAVFSLISSVFDEPLCDQSPAYVEKRLRREDFWAIAAIEDRAPVGGLTAYTLPMTRSQLDELLIYDLAVLPTHQRRGIGRRPIQTVQGLAADAGIETSWVPVANEDSHAIDFYRSIGGTPNPVTIVTFDRD